MPDLCQTYSSLPNLCHTSAIPRFEVWQQRNSYGVYVSCLPNLSCQTCQTNQPNFHKFREMCVSHLRYHTHATPTLIYFNNTITEKGMAGMAGLENPCAVYVSWLPNLPILPEHFRQAELGGISWFARHLGAFHVVLTRPAGASRWQCSSPAPFA
jgi:hypothetical protein